MSQDISLIPQKAINLSIKHFDTSGTFYWTSAGRNQALEVTPALVPAQ
jgi:hypothetical protein